MKTQPFKENSPRRTAFKDISNYLREQNLQIFDGNYDSWIVTPSRLCDKKISRLNAELGVHKVNKQWH